MNLSDLLTPERITFAVFTIPLVISAVMVVAAKNPMSAAIALVSVFFFLAGIYVLLSAHLVAFLQILVYAGAVMVLFLFVIMLLSLGTDQLEKERYRVIQVVGALAGAGVIVMGLAWMAFGEVSAEVATVPADFGTVKAVGRVLYSQFLLPFEAISILLLVAIVGAVVVAKEKI